MSDLTCTDGGCARPLFCRGLCVTHYHRAWRAGILESEPARRRVHILSNVNPEAKTGDCAECGPGTAVNVTHPNGTPRYRCDIAYRAGKKRRPGSVSRARYAGSRPSQKRDYRLRFKYGITLAEYESMATAQGGKCAICEAAAPLVVDHNHDTGVVRGLLCAMCNSGIGHLGDSPARLLSAVLYLNAFTSYGAS